MQAGLHTGVKKESVSHRHSQWLVLRDNPVVTRAVRVSETCSERRLGSVVYKAMIQKVQLDI